jgi:uncharacterized membrane protein
LRDREQQRDIKAKLFVMIEVAQPAPLATREIAKGNARIQSIDLLRGAVMIIMAIDHVRVYSGILAGGLDPGIFFTRWITHYCAPAFAFFAGTSALLYFQKTRDTNDVAKFLLTRGLILVVLEFTVVRFFWTFNFDYSTFNITGVIWMLGWCMVLVAAFVRIRPLTLAIIGLIIIFAQQMFAYVPDIFPASMQDSIRTVWGFFYPAGKAGVTIAGGSGGLPSAFGFDIFYVIIPWVGVMMAGYGFGQLLLLDPLKVKKVCLSIGIGSILLFIIAGTLLISQAPLAATDAPFLFKLLGQQKYPPSQLFLLMTLGPVIALVPWAQNVKGWLADAVKIIGRVPMFYYLLHLLVIHLSAFVVNIAISGSIHQDWYMTAPFVGVPEGERWSLYLLYLVWAVDVVILYFACRWYANYKLNHPENAWIKYL